MFLSKDKKMPVKKLLNNLSKSIMLRKMEYISDQQGIIRRYQREMPGWNIHLENSKRFILESSKLKKKGKAMVLGSGWLLDCPVNELAREFEDVILVDIYHPKQIQKKLKHITNVHFIQADITGGLIDLAYHTLNSNKKNFVKKFFPESKSFSFPISSDVDFVISLNILSQLNIIITDYAKRFNHYSENEITELSATIQQSHLNSLPKNKSCLICDYEEELYDEENKLIGVNPLIFLNLPAGNFSKKWNWKFDTSMTYRDDTKTYLNVIAIDL
ncbi:MAG: hypothetical protein A2X13_06980 [Bacteroidetes bacterium GWC2_33_15]|nr:MAG: hypothetical protein A2X10_11725 [Bacteroidetes bacterium GWA2_33_15]OFX51223.1 MAG: hypothetical protein A2X13_06980 [Bacteroidetes bacterium GWC2_33_15]OFX66333.1 MAG: hypothetical protein A2X15_00035 [Bacteroidetes bacterium GWB2_32_14]OFX70626.1 MAG: hypothetical protein A2X14_10720 [Bacteroidetes bacterium GWD2_33_33]HAN18789.1 hypothetical protein [Bacteroidales bacterium]